MLTFVVFGAGVLMGIVFERTMRARRAAAVPPPEHTTATIFPMPAMGRAIVTLTPPAGGSLRLMLPAALLGNEAEAAALSLWFSRSSTIASWGSALPVQTFGLADGRVLAFPPFIRPFKTAGLSFEGGKVRRVSLDAWAAEVERVMARHSAAAAEEEGGGTTPEVVKGDDKAHPE